MCRDFWGNKLKAKQQLQSYWCCVCISLIMLETALKTHLFLLVNQRVCWLLEVLRWTQLQVFLDLTHRKMGSQRNRSLDIHLLGPCWFLISILLLQALVLPALTLDSLLCYYSPLQPKGKPCTNTTCTSQCLPDQRCSSSIGRYGSFHMLSAQGCLDKELCGSHETVSYQGVEYNVSHTCCCKDKCNNEPKSDTSLKKLLGMIAAKTENDSMDIVRREESWDSCANFTKSTTTATKS